MQRVFFLAAYFFICANAFAQQYPFVQYTPKDGLINSRVRKSYQDSKGRMYFLTYNGLSAYDGVRFKNYTVQNGLASNLVNDILEIGNDSFLVATNTGYLNILANGTMSLLKANGDPTPLANQFYKHSKNEIYITSDNGLYLLKNNRFTKLNTDPVKEHHFFGGITGYNDFVVFTTNELKYFRGIYLFDAINNRICDAMPDKGVRSLEKDEKNRIWISSDEELYVLDSMALARGKLVLVTPPGNYRPAKNYPTFNISFDDKAALLVYYNKKIVRIDEQGSISEMALPEQVSSSGVSHILTDRENIIWLCNDGAGVFKIVNSPLRIFENPAERPMQHYASKAFCFKDTTWYSFNNNKLFRKTPQGLTEFSCNTERSPFIFHQAGEKVLAYDFWNMYKAILNEKSGSVNFIRTASVPDSNAFGKKLMVDTYGNIIAIMATGLGVWKNNKLVCHIPAQTSDLIEGLAFDKNNLLWVVKRYWETEVFSLHPEDSSKYLQLVFRFEKDQPGGSPRSFVIDKTGMIWIGTREHGLFACRLEGKQLKKILHFNIANGLTDNFITALACDSLNNIIAGTQTGVDRIIRDDADSYRVENVTKNGNFFAFISDVWADANNQSYALTSTGGLLQLSSSDAIKHKKNFTPQLLIEEMRVNAHVFPFSKTTFSYKENNISFSVAAPSFIDEKQIRFSYLLEGSGNDQWSDTSALNSVINLTNLSAGEYLLKVKAYFPSTYYPPAESSFAFEVTPPWWQTWWFRLAIGIVGIALLVAGFRFYYSRKLANQKVVLEKKQAIEKERTRIATDMHDDLGAGLSRIKFLSETIGIKKQQQQPIEEDISKIRQYSHEMIDKMGEIVWALNEKNDSLSDLLSYTRSYAAEYLAQNGIQCVVSLPEQLPAAFVSGEFRRNIFLAVKEILHNVVKHSQAGKVNITITLAHNLAIQIQDDGSGFDPAHIRPYSNGLPNIEKRMKDIGGTMKIVTGKGTAVNLSVPLPL
ncbi:MAG TPA: ATP-binding protein [Chitinophagaceae bacterium]